jgi:hypothetical protein
MTEVTSCSRNQRYLNNKNETALLPVSESLPVSKGLKSELALLSSEGLSLSADSEADSLNSEPELLPSFSESESDSSEEDTLTLFDARWAACRTKSSNNHNHTRSTAAQRTLTSSAEKHIKITLQPTDWGCLGGACRTRGRNAYTISVARPRRIWHGNIRMDLKEVWS